MIGSCVQGEGVMRAHALHLRFQVDSLTEDVDTAKMRLAAEMKVLRMHVHVNVIYFEYEHIVRLPPPATTSRAVSCHS